MSIDHSPERSSGYPALLSSLAAAWLLATLPFAALGADKIDGLACDLELRNAFGPFDFRTASDEQRRLVENHHFNSQVEGLVRGITGPLGGDIDYTLRVFPNHPRALLAMAKLARREGRAKPVGSTHTAECWFQRAIAFQPEDGYVRMVYGIEMLRSGRVDAAIEQLKIAERIRGPDANVAYNLGLAYFELRDYEASMEQARRAYQLGFPLPGLKDKLQRIGKWKD